MRPAKLNSNLNMVLNAEQLSTKIEPQINISKANASNDAKVELANAMGLRMIYCGDCKVVELEMGAVSLRLCPDVVQRMANMMVKASLKLDLIVDLPAKVETLSKARMIH